ncbi:uncharacterized protein MYCFIDRAFT_77964 [Pseudocercospora fijiensis CIRAD86]|uniref:Uncharacterized protein n=1 Tax=Pseudocercospora fijiensis (strain CIRAD86) TaxID=383855 RepID=M3ARX0_PSEFD|nr:uncharacterized protein MYCFIDRAFT_77964 [Pseudocercospora fijiensis CIRAD86]EME80202.1 hypothetical protein MYCFIDRAFT_77964 [Pseudocercospora fijiensis CIRAD86]
MKTQKQPLYKAEVFKTAQDDGPVKPHPDQAAVDKARKCLERGQHPNASEFEAKTALTIAAEIMERAGISHAQILVGAPREEQQESAGHAIVRILRNDGKENGEVNQNVFVGTLCRAMTTFFDCKYYTATYKPRTKLEIVFYGVASNVDLAADAFARIYNLSLAWALNPEFKGLRGRNSYCLGIAQELKDKAQKEKDAEEARAIEAEARTAAEREQQEQQEAVDEQARVDRLNASHWASPEEERNALLRQAFERVGVNLFGERMPDRTANRSRLLNAISNRVLDLRSDQILSANGKHKPDLSLYSDLQEPEASRMLNRLMEQGHVVHTDDMTVVISNEMNRHLGLASSEDCGDYLDDDDLSDDDEEYGAAVSGEDDDDFEEADVEIEERGTKFPLDLSSASLQPPLPITTAKSTPPVKSVDAILAAPIEKPQQLEYESHMQLVLKRETFSQIADDCLKEMNIKLRAGRKRKIKHLDMSAYDQGRIDGKKIDVRQQERIKRHGEKFGILLLRSAGFEIDWRQYWAAEAHQATWRKVWDFCAAFRELGDRLATEPRTEDCGYTHNLYTKTL